jgi:hypothetical protein
VRYTPKAEPNGLAAHVWIDCPGRPTFGRAWGSFYVMNDMGKTVAKYDLGGWIGPQPEESKPAA